MFLLQSGQIRRYLCPKVVNTFGQVLANLTTLGQCWPLWGKYIGEFGHFGAKA
jgi:hypothetical protein